MILLPAISTIRFGVHAKALKKGPMILVQSSAIGDFGKIHTNFLQRTAVEVVRFREEDVLQPGDVLLIGKGAKRLAAVWPGSNEDALASSVLFVIRPHPDINPLFVASFLNSTPAQAHMARYTKPGSVQSVGRTALDTLPIPRLDGALQHTMAKLYEAEHRFHQTLQKLADVRRSYTDAAWAKLIQDSPNT